MNDRLRVMQRQPRRVSITISHHVYQTLLNRSEEEGRSMSNLCAFLLEEVLQHPHQLPTPQVVPQRLDALPPPLTAHDLRGNGNAVVSGLSPY